jgi:hypothetical protein
MNYAIRTIGLFFIMTSLIGCAAPQATPQSTPQIQKVEVTQVVTQEVTREVTKIVEVTRQVIVTATPLPPTETPTSVALKPQDAQASLFIKGNGSPKFPDGEAGKISVVAVGKYAGNILPVIIRNNTASAVIRVKVSVTANDKDGKMLASGGDQGFIPNLVKPGEITMGYAYFDSVKLPEDAKYVFETSAEASDGKFATFENIRDLELVEVSQVGNRAVGKLKNQYDKEVNGPIGVVAYCFNDKNELLGRSSTYAAKNKAAPGDTIPFQVDLKTCPIFLVAGSAFAAP